MRNSDIDLSIGSMGSRLSLVYLSHLAPILLLLAAWGARLLAYANEELGLDGHLSVGLALLPTDRLLEFLARDVHPPLYYLVLKAWLTNAGVSFLTARWLSLAAGMLALALLYRLAVKLAGRPGALVALALLALSPAHIAASATVRDFAPGLLLSIGTLVLWWELDRVGAGRSRHLLLAALALLTALALATWYFHAIFLAIQLVDLLVRRERRVGEPAALGLGAAFQLPWLVYAVPPLAAKVLGGVTVSGDPPSPAPWQAVASGLGEAFVGGAQPIGSVGALAWGALALLGLAHAYHKSAVRMRWAVSVTLGILMGAIATYGLASAWASPALLHRYGLVTLPWATIAHVWAFHSPLNAPPPPSRRHWYSRIGIMHTFGIILAVLVLSSQVLSYLALIRSKPATWTVEPAVGVVETDGSLGDSVIFTDHARFGFYALRRKVEYPSATIHIAGSAFLRDDVPGVAAGLLDPLLAQRGRVWLSYDRPGYEEGVNEIRRRLMADRFRVRQEERGPTIVELYAPSPELTAKHGGRQFGGMIALDSSAVSPSAEAGEPVFVELHWRAIRRPDGDYKVFAHLVDDRGERIAQHDSVPVFGMRPPVDWTPGEIVVDRFVVQTPASASPGAYRLLVGLYQGPLRLQLEDKTDHVVLGPITISRPVR